MKIIRSRHSDRTEPTQRSANALEVAALSRQFHRPEDGQGIVKPKLPK